MADSVTIIKMESTDTLGIEKPIDLCRLCLKATSTTISLYSTANLPESIENDCMLTLRTIYYRLSKLQVRNHDQLPQQICIQCSINLIETYITIETWKQNHSKLTDDYDTVAQKAVEAIPIPPYYETLDSLDHPDELQVEEASMELYSEDGKRFVVEQVDNEGMLVETDYVEKSIVIDENGDITEMEQKRGDEHACLMCDRSFTTLGRLEKHLLIHTGGGFECETCHVQLSTLERRQRHMQTVHNAEYKYNKYRCHLCAGKYKSSTSLRKHLLRIHHTSEKPPKVQVYRCGFCALETESKAEIDEHRRNHKIYECDVCHKTYRSISNLKNHYTIHSQIQRFKCSFCHKKFRLKESLTKHLRALVCRKNKRLLSKMNAKTSRVVEIPKKDEVNVAVEFIQFHELS